MKRKHVWSRNGYLLLLGVLGVLLGLMTGCGAPVDSTASTSIITSRPPATAQLPALFTPVSPTQTMTPPPTSTVAASLPSATPDLLPGTSANAGLASIELPTPTTWPTVTRQVLPAEVAAGLPPCAQRVMTDDWLIVVTQQFGLPESYSPPDLVSLSDYFSTAVTVGIESTVRAGLIDPLQQLIAAMHAAGLEPSILSGYRSYSEQYLAWKWWNSQYPERVAIMSARAGHSEHQLGATVDFGSPALNHLFHVDFAGTPEGEWLAANAHRYGFTMSYPANAYDVTGFKYEPWHYRYVGIELSTELHATGQLLTAWQLENRPPPCIP